MEPIIDPGANGQPETIRVMLGQSGRPWDMPVHTAVQIIESLASAHPRLFGDHLQAALMGTEIPSSGRRSRASS
jgi:hypothetical protein